MLPFRTPASALAATLAHRDVLVPKKRIATAAPKTPVVFKLDVCFRLLAFYHAGLVLECNCRVCVRVIVTLRFT